MKIAFIGLGIMGSRMAANLLKNGVDVTVWNRSKAPVEALKRKGAKVADTVNHAVADKDLVFSMLSTPEVVRDLFLREGGGLSVMKAKAIWVDCSTVNPSFSLEAAKGAANLNIRFVDAPVAGTKPQAENAELVFFTGGTQTLLEVVTPYLNMMGKKVVPIGETGKGAAFKMLVNIMLAQSMTTFSETVLLGEKMGISKDFLLDVIPNMVVSAPFTKFKAAMVKSGDYEVQFPLEWMHKDLNLAVVTALEYHQPMHLVNVVKELFAEANENGLGRLDFAAIHRFLEEK